MKVILIIPAYNEQDNILNTVNKIKEFDKDLDYIVINDGSKDNTLEICKKNNINVISLPINYGLSSAIQLGMKYAIENKYDVAVQFDGDGQHKVEYVGSLVKKISQGANIAIGSRFVNKKKEVSSRMIGSRIITFFIKMITGKLITDPTSGMRAFDRKCMKELATNINLPPEPDMLVYMLKNGMKVEEVQVEMQDREFGESYLNKWRAIEYMLNVVTSIVFIQSFRKNKKEKRK